MIRDFFFRLRKIIYHQFQLHLMIFFFYFTNKIKIKTIFYCLYAYKFVSIK